MYVITKIGCYLAFTRAFVFTFWRHDDTIPDDSLFQDRVRLGVVKVVAASLSNLPALKLQMLRDAQQHDKGQKQKGSVIVFY
jgi:hypothetical protein